MEKGILLYFLVEFQSVDIYCLPRRFYRHEYFSGFDSYPDVFNLDPIHGAISLLDEFWQSTQTMFSMTAMVADHGIPSLTSVVPVYVSFRMAYLSIVYVAKEVRDICMYGEIKEN